MKDVIIIGGGPAGASAAVFLARAGKDTIIIDEGKTMLRRAHLQNYLGAAEGITGTDLYVLGLRQARAAGAAVHQGRVLNLEALAGGGFRVRTEDSAFEARHLLLATGSSTALAPSLGLALVPGREPHMKEVFQVDGDGRTNVPGVYAAGTAAGTSVHAIVAAGDGARVAINMLSDMAGSRHVDHVVAKAAGA